MPTTTRPKIRITLGLIILALAAHFSSAPSAMAGKGKKIFCNSSGLAGQQAALVDGEMMYSSSENSRVVVDMHSVMLVSPEGMRSNADEHFFHSFWGEQKDGSLILEPNEDGEEVSRVKSIEINMSGTDGKVVMKNKKVYLMACRFN